MKELGDHRNTHGIISFHVINKNMDRVFTLCNSLMILLLKGDEQKVIIFTVTGHGTNRSP
jgi:hypothetical protein